MNAPASDRSPWGKIAIVGIVLLAITMGGFAWWVNFSYSDELRQHWSAHALRMIESAPEARLLFLAPVGDAGEEESGSPTVHEGTSQVVVETQSISKAPGWLHARHALIEDVGYDFDQAPQDPTWEYALQFSGGQGDPVELLLDITHGYVREQQSGQALTLAKATHEALQTFMRQRVSRE